MTSDKGVVEVVACERNAIYVNNTRITHRGTKWGVRAVLASFECPADRVVAECLARGLHDHVKAIDTEPYESAARAALSPQPTPTDK